MNVPYSIPLVDKMLIADMHFPHGEVLSSAEDIKRRSSLLHQATSLGNLDKHKVYITFEDAVGIRRVYTTIWAITSNKILLKAGRSIPIERIHKVDLQA